jgi:hypothetical protein
MEQRKIHALYIYIYSAAASTRPKGPSTTTKQDIPDLYRQARNLMHTYSDMLSKVYAWVFFLSTNHGDSVNWSTDATKC